MGRILLVSDSPGFLERNKSFLEKAGYRVFTAATAGEALELQREVMAQVIIAMLDLSDTSGDLLCSMIRNDPGLAKVSIILVCYQSPEALQRAAACGADAWVVKPVQPQLLLGAVGDLLRRRQPREPRVQLTAPVKGLNGSTRFDAILHNISVSGILCETNLELISAALTTLHIGLQGGEVVAEGKVVRRMVNSNGRFDYGFQFLQLTPSARLQITSLVEGMAGEEYLHPPAVRI